MNRSLHRIQNNDLSTFIQEVGNEIKLRIDDPYRYMIKREYIPIKTRKLEPIQKGETIKITSLWSKKMHKKVDEVMKFYQERKIPNQPIQIEQDRRSSINASELIEQLGLKSFMPKKGRKLKLQSMLLDSVKRPQKLNHAISENLLNSIDFYNSQSTTSSVKNLLNYSHAKRYSEHGIIGLKKCLEDCDSQLNESKELNQSINDLESITKGSGRKKSQREFNSMILNIKRIRESYQNRFSNS